MATPGSKIFHDPIHGPMEFEPVLVKIIDTPEFQRLRRIKQLGGGCYVYPGATHTRFDHSLGVCHLAGKFEEHLFEAAKKDELDIGLTPEEIKFAGLCIKVAGLCHDLGHGPFSHMFQDFAHTTMQIEGWKHEDMSVKILEKILARKCVDDPNEENWTKLKDNIEFIGDLIKGSKGKSGKEHFLYQIVANKDTGIDVDKWDYLARDCHYLGLSNDFQWKRCMMLARVKNVGTPDYQICYRDSAIANIIAMFRTRSTLHQKAYQHPRIKAVEHMMIDCLHNMVDCELHVHGLEKTLRGTLEDKDPNEYVKLDDSIVESLQQVVDETQDGMKEAYGLIEKLRTRKLYTYLGFAKSKLDRSSTEEKIRDKLGVHIATSVVEVKFGSERDNPLGNLWFYPKTSDGECTKCDLQQAQHIQLGGLLLPLKFKSPQCEVRFYCKGTADRSSCMVTIKTFLAENQDIFGALTKYEGYFSMTEGNTED